MLCVCAMQENPPKETAESTIINRVPKESVEEATTEIPFVISVSDISQYFKYGLGNGICKNI